MRIIGGQWKSRRIDRPRSTATRPVPDRVRESVFNMLGHYYGLLGALPTIVVADVFAGGGSMGLEALSRGAARCVFFEQDRCALAVLRRNIRALDAEDQAMIVSGDAWSEAGGARAGESPRLIFLDPPYRESEDVSPQGKLWRLLDRLAEPPAPGRLLVLHHARRVDCCDMQLAAWRIVDRRVIGSNGLTVFEQ